MKIGNLLVERCISNVRACDVLLALPFRCDQVTECRCSVGSIKIEVGGSKHDGIYNFLAKGLGDTIRCV